MELVEREREMLKSASRERPFSLPLARALLFCCPKPRAADLFVSLSLERQQSALGEVYSPRGCLPDASPTTTIPMRFGVGSSPRVNTRLFFCSRHLSSGAKATLSSYNAYVVPSTYCDTVITHSFSSRNVLLPRHKLPVSTIMCGWCLHTVD